MSGRKIVPDTTRAAVCALAAFVVLADAPWYPVAAQETAGPARPKSKAAKVQTAGPNAGDAAVAKDPAAATRSFTTGVTAYQAGKYEQAIASMNAAIDNGGLPGSLLAKALYYRGASFHHQGKSGQAISDLTSALWLKDGLDAAERLEAQQLRSKAYAAAGLTEQGGVVADARSSADLATPTVAETAPAGGGLGEFFGNLFGGTAKPAAPETTASTTDTQEVLPWANSGLTTGSLPPDAAIPGTQAPSGKPKPARAARKGTYRIQVAAVKSRDEASAVISTLQEKGGLLSAMAATVDESKFGATTFYRVRLGPYADAAATKSTCDALKASGLDCLVTAK